MKPVHLVIIGCCLCFLTQVQAEEAATRDASSGARDWLFGGSLGFYGNGALSLPMMSTHGTPLQQRIGSSMRFAVEAAYVGRHAWGLNFGLAADSTKQIANAKDSVPDFAGKGGNSEVSVSTLYANALYRWQQVYVPFGLNVSRITISQASTALEQVSSFPGLQAGLGYFITDYFSLEAGIRLIGIQARYEGRFSSEYRTGFLIEQVLSVKGYF